MATTIFVRGINLEQIIQEILDMEGGTWDQDTVVRALHAAFNNPERAVDYFYSENKEGHELLTTAIAKAEYTDKVVIGMDVGASEFDAEKDKTYDFNIKGEDQGLLHMQKSRYAFLPKPPWLLSLSHWSVSEMVATWEHQGYHSITFLNCLGFCKFFIEV